MADSGPGGEDDADRAKLMALAARGFQDQLNSHLGKLGRADNEFAGSVRRNTNSSWLGIDLPARNVPGVPQNVTDAPYDADERKKQTAGTGKAYVRNRRRQGDLPGRRQSDHRIADARRQSSGVYTAADDGKRPVSFDLYSPKGDLVSGSVKESDGTVVTTLQRTGRAPVIVTKKPGQDAVARVDERTLSSPSSMRLWTPRRRHSIQGHTARPNSGVTTKRQGSFPDSNRRTSGCRCDMVQPMVTVMSTLYYGVGR